jgi:hypothetical protein
VHAQIEPQPSSSNVFSGEVINQNQGEFDLLSQATRKKILESKVIVVVSDEPKTDDASKTSLIDESETESDNFVAHMKRHLEVSSDESETNDDNEVYLLTNYDDLTINQSPVTEEVMNSVQNEHDATQSLTRNAATMSISQSEIPNKSKKRSRNRPRKRLKKKSKGNDGLHESSTEITASDLNDSKNDEVLETLLIDESGQSNSDTYENLSLMIRNNYFSLMTNSYNFDLQRVMSFLTTYLPNAIIEENSIILITNVNNDVIGIKLSQEVYNALLNKFKNITPKKQLKI